MADEVDVPTASETAKLPDVETRLEQLLEGSNRHITTAYRAWVTLALVSIYALAARPTGAEEDVALPLMKEVKLPYAGFALITACLLLALIVRWIEAQSRYQKTRETVDGLHALFVTKRQEAKDHWDSRVVLGSSTTWAMWERLASYSSTWKAIARRSRWALKVLVAAVHFLLPLVALLVLALSDPLLESQTRWVLWHIAIWAVMLASGVVLALGLMVEYKYAVRAKLPGD